MGHTNTVDTETSAILDAITSHPDFSKLGFEEDILAYVPLYGLMHIFSKLPPTTNPQNLAATISENRREYRKQPYKALKAISA